jgi:teichuronic acid biosynthesis glycosyltransferase TuaH
LEVINNVKLNGHNIIVFALPRVNSEIESTNYTTARLLARNNTVYYVENPYTLKDYFKFRKSSDYSSRKEFLSLFSTKVAKTDTNNLFLIFPPVIFSINFLPEGKFFRFLLGINEFLISFKLKRIFRELKIKNYIYINSFNFHYPTLARFLEPDFTVYHCLDPLVFFFNRKHGDRSEEILSKDSDAVICSSKALYEEKRVFNPNTYFVPNAADLSHSSKVLDPELKVNERLNGLKSPVIGYFGAIERRMDYAMLKTVIESNLDKTFVFVGPVTEEFVPEGFRKLPNIKFTGPVPYHEMPSVVKGFDVALIPFKKDEVSNTIFPLKLFEYLGAGKSVVCTDFNMDLAEFTEGTVEFCSDAKSFSEAIGNAIKLDSPERKEDRLKVASQNTWERRVDEIAAIIHQGITNN